MRDANIVNVYQQDMINQMSRGWREGQSVNLSGSTADKPPPLIQKKDQLNQSRHSIQSKLTRLYFEELSKVPHATPDSVLVCFLNIFTQLLS